MRQAVLALVVSGCFFKPTPPGSIGDDAHSAIDARSGDGSDGGQYMAANYMFVSPTAVQAIGTLSWETLSETCQDWARMQGLPSPSTFIAAVQRTDGPDISTMLSSSVGFYRMDSQPIGETWADMVAGRILYPPSLDLNSKNVTVQVFTGFDPMAPTHQARDCSTDSIGRYGSSFAAGRTWISEPADRVCDQASYFYCVGTGVQAPVGMLTAPVDAKHAWVTSTATFDGTGPGANRNCVDSLSGVVLAYNAAGTLLNVAQGGPWYRPDGVNLGSNLQQPAAPIAVTAMGDPILDGETAWLGRGPTNCTNWMASNPAKFGGVITIDDPAANIASPGCDTTHHLICFEQ